MPTYVYETIPSDPSKPKRRFEVRQSMKDAPLTHDPETGEPVKRIISGGYGFITGADASSSGAASAPSGGGCCGGACGCSHH
ncbi:MAG: zinc ribbon domain-containing protein [Verrucomicrobia bacterium]|nr:MAG: zinc ribbon domain-containing protein [Verrucomicrobiota bacterium]